MKTIPCELLQSNMVWEEKLIAVCINPQIGMIKHLLLHCHALFSKLSHNHIPTFWPTIYFAGVRIDVAPKNIGGFDGLYGF